MRGQRPSWGISIHALLTESDSLLCYMIHLRSYFYPRSPYGERLPALHNILKLFPISIHALLTESDSSCCGWFQVIHYFYPRSPYGERPRCQLPTTQPPNFYPRSPYGERQLPKQIGKVKRDFYPRSPYGERRMIHMQKFCVSTFLSTLSLRRATALPTANNATTKFLSTLSLRRATVFTMIIITCTASFLSTLSLRRATEPENPIVAYDNDFYPRSPYGERLGLDGRFKL